MKTLPGFLSRLLQDRLLRMLAPVVGMVVLLVVLAASSFHILSSLRAFVNGESLWSKAQLEAMLQLRQYTALGRETDYRAFLSSLAISQDARTGRLSLERIPPDLHAARAGFLAAANHPDDIEGMIWLYRYFARAPYVETAVDNWRRGDELIRQLQEAGAVFHDQRHALTTAMAEGDVARRRIDAELIRLDKAFGPIEAGFSDALGMASRLTLTVLTTAIVLTAAALLFLLATFFRRLMVASERSREELDLSVERFHLGFQGTNCGLWDWNIVTNDVFYSSWIYKLLEYGSQNTGMNMMFIEMVHPEDRAATLAAGTAHIINRVPYDIQYRIRTLSGKYLWVRSRAEAVRDASGKAVRMVGSIFDISHLKQIEDRAYIERELAQITLGAIADAVLRTDLDGHIDYCNAVAEKLLGQKSTAICGQPLSAVCRLVDESDPERTIDIVCPVLSGQTMLYENPNLQLLRADDSLVAVDASAAAVHDQAGKFFGVVVILHDVSAEREHAAQLSYQASHDELTGLVNRREFELQLARLLTQPPALRAYQAMMYIDLDQLKIVNDSGGHAAGDQLIRQLSALLKQRLRDGDLLARLGGDEFGVILNHCSGDDAFRVAEALRELIFNTRFVWDGKAYPTGLSIGLVPELDQFDSIGDLLKVADAACFMAKEKGRNRVHRYRADDHELSLRHREIEWVSRIGDALDQNRFRLHAQRIVATGAADPRSQHVELLLRMVDTDGKLIPPMSFIPAAERYNLMPAIDRWVIQEVFATLADGFARGVDADHVTCAINLSGASMEDEHFLDYILEQQHRHGIPLSTICFEITETAAIANLPKAAAFIGRLRAVGCYFSLDDFGAGMASFGYLKHLPVDFLKIDGSFVKDMMHNPIDRAMVEAINQIGHVMQKKTIAEFVEDDATLDCLRRIGVDYAQGYGIARPEPFHALFLLGDPMTAQHENHEQTAGKALLA